MNIAALLLLGPVALSAPTSLPQTIEREIAADHAQIAATQSCLMAAHRLRTGDQPDDWPFAQQPFDVEQDASRCGLR